MTQYSLFDYQARNYTKTSKDAYEKQLPKTETKREQVHNIIKSQPMCNEHIAEELDMVLSSVCARVRELQILNLIKDSGKRVTTKHGRKAIVWENISLKP